MEVDHKIVVPSSNSKIKTEPLPQEEPKLDAGHNPFLEEDQRALVDELEELIHPSECTKWVHLFLWMFLLLMTAQSISKQSVIHRETGINFGPKPVSLFRYIPKYTHWWLLIARAMQDQHGAGSVVDSEDENPSPRKK